MRLSSSNELGVVGTAVSSLFLLGVASVLARERLNGVLLISRLLWLVYVRLSTSVGLNSIEKTSQL